MKLALTILGLVVTAAVFFVAAFLLLDAMRPQPVAANFTRVGGATRVKTSIEAARFWVQPPEVVYKTSATARDDIMLRAAECAASYGAPLLFTTSSKQQQRQSRRLMRRWGWPRVRNVQTTSGCVPNRDKASRERLHRLTGQEQLLAARVEPYLRDVETQSKLESVVVFAASKTPRSPADVAVALPLAAHIAKQGGDVSFVVLPRYLAADPGLDEQLRKSSDLVSSGVVVGGAGSVPEETRLVLRQILRPSNVPGVLSGVRTTLGDFGLLIAAIAALFVGGAAAKTAASPLIVRITSPIREVTRMESGSQGSRPTGGRRWGRRVEEVKPADEPMPETEDTGKKGGDAKPPEPTSTRVNPFAVDTADGPTITLLLGDRREVSGVYQGEVTIGSRAFMKLRAAHLAWSRGERSSFADALLVPVEAIEVAGVGLKRDDRQPPGDP